jgi:hypothetical protein
MKAGYLIIYGVAEIENGKIYTRKAVIYEVYAEHSKVVRI